MASDNENTQDYYRALNAGGTLKALTVAHLLDVVSRATSVLQPLITELGQIATLCERIIGGSHMGCAADEVILQEGDEGEEPPATCATCGEAHTADSQCPVAIGEREAPAED